MGGFAFLVPYHPFGPQLVPYFRHRGSEFVGEVLAPVHPYWHEPAVAGGVRRQAVLLVR